MKLIDRYVGSQVLLTSTIAVAVLSVVLVLGNIFKQLLELLVKSDMPMDQIFALLAYILPFSLTFTIPWGFLTAVLLVFGKMSAENELIALRATGVSIPRVTLPVLVLAVLSVGACLWINVDIAPHAHAQMKEALYTMATSNPMAIFGNDKVIELFPGRKIYVERSEGAKLFNLIVYEMDDDYLPVRVIMAGRGTIGTDHDKKQLLLQLFDARYEQRDKDEPENLMKIRPLTAHEWPVQISLEELSEKKHKGISSMSAGELLERINMEEQNARMSDKDRREAVSAARTEMSRRYAYALASFAFALIGVPLAITAHRKETSVGFLLSVAVGVTYFFLSMTAYGQRNHPELHPEFLIWIPNFLCLVLGGTLFFRMSRR
ncbi:MAG: LptF/LptG family permease [Chthoniobacter sp.]|nr:LptF/LptG family permease [Chthoniobacter sp.]